MPKTKRNGNGTVGKINRQFKLDNIIFEMVSRSLEKSFTRLYRLFYEMFNGLEAQSAQHERYTLFIHSFNPNRMCENNEKGNIAVPIH